MPATDFNKLSKELSGSSGFFGSFLLFIIIALVAILLFWANITELDNVTRGEGKIVSSLQNQLIQTSEGGVIKARFVETGEKVNKDQILFEIDPIDAKTSYDQALQRLSSLKIQESRLSAEVLGEEPNFENELQNMAPTVVTVERALYSARKADLNAQLSVLKQQLTQREQQLNEVDVTIETTRDTLKFVEKQISIIEPLVKLQQYPETELLNLQRQAKDFEGKRNLLIVDMLYSTGIRRDELINIKINDVLVHENVIKVLGKRNKERMVPVILKLKKIINDYLTLRDNIKSNSDCFLITKKGKKIGPSLVYRVVKNYFSKVSTKVKTSPHVLRHSFATHMLNNGADINSIKEIMGHSSLASTQIYTKIKLPKIVNDYKKNHPREKKK